MVPHRSTNLASSCLTSESGRVPVLSTVYGRSFSQFCWLKLMYYYFVIFIITFYQHFSSYTTHQFISLLYLNILFHLFLPSFNRFFFMFIFVRRYTFLPFPITISRLQCKTYLIYIKFQIFHLFSNFFPKYVIDFISLFHFFFHYIIFPTHWFFQMGSLRGVPPTGFQMEGFPYISGINKNFTLEFFLFITASCTCFQLFPNNLSHFIVNFYTDPKSNNLDKQNTQKLSSE